MDASVINSGKAGFMRTAVRVIYPILLYTAVTMVISFLGFVVVSVFTLQFRMQTQTRLLAEYLIEECNRYMLVFALVSALCTIPIHLWLFCRDQFFRGIAPGKKLVIPEFFKYLVLAGISGCIVGNNLIEWSGITRFFTGFEQVSQSLYSPPILLQLVSIGFVLPVVEELTFRALGFRRLRDSMGFYGSAVISSLCFAVFHGNVPQGIYAFFLGLLMSYVYEKCQNFLAPVIVHCAANLASISLTATELGHLLFLNNYIIAAVTVVSFIFMTVCIWKIGCCADSDAEGTG